MKPFFLSPLCAPLILVLLASVPAHADTPTVGVIVNGSTVTLTQGVPTAVGAGTVLAVDIGNIIATPDGSVSESGLLTVNGLSVPLTARVLSFTPSAGPGGGGTLQYALDGGGPLDFGALGEITVQPYGGTVSPSYAAVRVPVVATFTWRAAPLASAPEPSSWAALSLGSLGLLALAVRRRIRV